MSLRFRPPPLAGFYAGGDADHAAALVEAREQGFAEGHATGLLEGRAAGLADGATQARDELLPELDALQESSAKRIRYDAVAQSLQRLIGERASDLAALESAVREVATAALRTLFPVLLNRAAGAEIAAILADALAERAPETLILRAHPDTLAAVAAETAGASGKDRLKLAPDPNRAFGMVEIGWTGGGLTFDPAALLSHVTAALAAGSTPPTAPSMLDPSIAGAAENAVPAALPPPPPNGPTPIGPTAMEETPMEPASGPLPSSPQP